MAIADRHTMPLRSNRLKPVEVSRPDSDKSVVTFLSLARQARIEQLVHQSPTKQLQPTQLLDQAKSRVEQRIEKAVQA